jgi:hypothetical protein
MNKMPSKTKISITILMLKFLLGFFATPIMAEEKKISRNMLTLVPPNFPENLEFRKQFAKSIHRIASEEIDAKGISELLGWPILKYESSKNGDSEEATFKMYEKWGNPHYSYSRIRKRQFSAQLHPDYICIKGSDILEEFGYKFERSVWNVDTWQRPQIEQKKISDEIRRNFQIFSWGPRYKIILKEQEYSVLFDFRESECARGFSIN